uniref:Uncharacterized protein n=1 Tax=Setaria italica TaxID=4555 RepID=K4AN47_SETIT
MQCNSLYSCNINLGQLLLTKDPMTLLELKVCIRFQFIWSAVLLWLLLRYPFQ